jgi:coproporphyrinogen III oxidase-like Fe-S oxidoreductase
VNRLSIGAQSFDDGTLRRLGRIHAARRRASAWRWRAPQGFRNIGWM